MAAASGHQLLPGRTITLSGVAETVSVDSVRRLPPEGPPSQSRPWAICSGRPGSRQTGSSKGASGMLAKLYEGAGVGVAHSSVPAALGLLGAIAPPRA